MNLFAVGRFLGLLLLYIGLTMILPLLWASYYNDGTWLKLLYSILITIAAGGIFFAFGSLRRQEIFRKEALAIVGLGWLLVAAFGALPFLLTGAIPNFIDAYFESMSGFTTTGSSIIGDVESLPPSILFWRSFTHFLGGLGIVLLFIAVLPLLGAGGRHLFKFEATGVIKESLTPRIKETARVLWRIYILLTAVQTLLLLIAGMNLLDALCHTFGTLATGGYSTKNQSIAYYHSLTIEIIIIVFILIGATNFSLHFKALPSKPKIYPTDPEWQAYLLLLLSSILLLTVNLWFNNIYPSPWTSLRYAAFQVASIMTNTGFVTADFNLWTPGAKTLLVVLMFIGGCTGSTAGGIKVLRWLILSKIARYQLHKVFSPRSVRQIKIGNHPISEELQSATLIFFFIYVLIFISATFFISLFNVDLITSATSVAATMNNCGPGLEKVGAVENFGHLPAPVKALLSILMVIGRLELYAILVLFYPRFWRSY